MNIFEHDTIAVRFVPDDQVKIICPECHGNGYHRHIGDDGLTIKQCARCKSEGEL